VHLVGFIIKKLVTMHGHMNVIYELRDSTRTLLPFQQYHVHQPPAHLTSKYFRKNIFQWQLQNSKIITHKRSYSLISLADPSNSSTHLREKPSVRRGKMGLKFSFTYRGKLRERCTLYL